MLSELVVENLFRGEAAGGGLGIPQPPQQPA